MTLFFPHIWRMWWGKRGRCLRVQMAQSAGPYPPWAWRNTRTCIGPIIQMWWCGVRATSTYNMKRPLFVNFFIGAWNFIMCTFSGFTLTLYLIFNPILRILQVSFYTEQVWAKSFKSAFCGTQIQMQIYVPGLFFCMRDMNKLLKRFLAEKM